MATLLKISASRFLIIALIVLFGCKHSDKNSSLIFEELNESLERSIRVSERASKLELDALKEKERELAYGIKAAYWHGKADTIHLISNKIIDIIDSIKQKCKIETVEKLKKDFETFFNELKNYKNSIIKLDSAYLREFDKKDNAIASKYLKRFNTEKEFGERMSGLAKAEIFTSFLEMQNDIRVTENDLINFSKNQFGGCILDYTHISAIVVPSSNHLKSGDELEINAGIGSFSTACKPKCKIGDTAINVNENGVAFYKSKITKSPGKYQIPVEIEYTDEKGERQKFTKEVEYTVDK